MEECISVFDICLKWVLVPLVHIPGSNYGEIPRELEIENIIQSITTRTKRQIYTVHNTTEKNTLLKLGVYVGV
jgi:ribosomal protein S25